MRASDKKNNVFHKSGNAVRIPIPLIVRTVFNGTEIEL